MDTDMFSGYFSRLGSIHLHIDGVGKDDVVQSVLKQLDMEKVPWKISAITDAVLGPQASEYPVEYDCHNPVSSTDGKLDYFATIDISEGLELAYPSTDAANEARNRTIHRLKAILPRLVNCHGIVVEVEQIIGKIDYDGRWQEVSSDTIPPFMSNEVGFSVAPTLPVEVHHAFNLPKSGDTIPISLENLMADCTRLGMIIGGWFIFQSHNQWRYRSNLFRRTSPHFRSAAQHQDDILRQHLRHCGLNFTQKTVVERILGIWKFDRDPYLYVTG